MNYSDEILMAYADGELGEPQRSEVEAAVRTDPALASIVEGHRALRRDVSAAFAGVLDEPVPARLQAAPARARCSRSRPRATPGRAPRPRRSKRSWPTWAALAATLVVGVLAGASGWAAARAGTIWSAPRRADA